jgi:hypothetical protein
MFSVELARSKSLLVISAAKDVSAADLKKAAEEVRRVLSDVRPGFKAMTDFRWLDSMDASGARYVAEIMDELANKQVARIVRVVPDAHKDIGLNILSQFHYGPGIQITTFENLADAMQSLMEETERPRAQEPEG